MNNTKKMNGIYDLFNAGYHVSRMKTVRAGTHSFPFGVPVPCGEEYVLNRGPKWLKHGNLSKTFEVLLYFYKVKKTKK